MGRLIAALWLSWSAPAFALNASDFSSLEGWTIAAVTSVRDTFEGCEHGKKVKFENGWSLTCAEYSYNYSYNPDAVIFAKALEVRGRELWLLKALIDDEMYDMEPAPVKPRR